VECFPDKAKSVKILAWTNSFLKKGRVADTYLPFAPQNPLFSHAGNKPPIVLEAVFGFDGVTLYREVSGVRRELRAGECP